MPKKSKKAEQNITEALITAIIYRKGKHEVRRYSLTTHGDKFIELAQEFAKKHAGEDYTLELLD